jgi:NitT/TauT family transport system permease protein
MPESPRRGGSARVVVPGILGGALVAISISATGGIASYLPLATLDLFYSFSRMVIAYALSLGFSLAYGYVAATNRAAERIMIPVLDILQSVPILGFLPAVAAFLIALTPGSSIGINLASIILVFTSMAWNMVFGVYESLKSVPAELQEAANSFAVSGWQRLRQLLLPATVNRLVYNSILSWTGGWFFLVAAEIFGASKHLQGIGSFLLLEAEAKQNDAVLAGLLVLIVLIVLLDVFVWRPLSQWAERYRYDTAPSLEPGNPTPRRGTAPLRRVATVIARGVRTGFVRASAPFVSLSEYALGRGPTRRRSLAASIARYAALGALLLVVWLMLIAISVAIFHIFARPVGPTGMAQIRTIPIDLASSLGRLAAAYAIALGIAFPLALLLTHHRRAGRLGLPTVEIIASIPATAIFPLVVVTLVGYLGAEATSILLLLTGMIWYLFFNLLSGMRAVPPDLEEAARSFGIRGGPYFRRVLLPAIFPAFVTGSITAFGGGWNTLIVAEWLGSTSSTPVFQVPGIGQLLDLGFYENNYAVLVAALFSLVISVIALNELLWKPLYRRAVEKYRYE